MNCKRCDLETSPDYIRYSKLSERGLCADCEQTDFTLSLWLKDSYAATHGRDVGYWGDIPIGETYVILESQHRDSDNLGESNFAVISEDMGERFPDDTAIVRFNHWAVGWVEYLCVRAVDLDDNNYITPTPAGLACIEWREQLDRYPVASDDDYSEREWEDIERGNDESLNDSLSALDIELSESDQSDLLRWIRDNYSEVTESPDSAWGIDVAMVWEGLIELDLYTEDSLIALVQDSDSWQLERFVENALRDALGYQFMLDNRYKTL